MRFRFIAVVVLLAVAETACRSARGYLDRGNKLYDSDKLEEAALNYRKAIQKNPKLSEAYYRLGLTESKQGNSQQAYAALSHAVQLQPGDDRIQVALADLELADYLTDRRHPQWVYSQLTKFSDEALKKNPNSFDGLRVKGYLALTDRKLDEALEYFRKANQAKPMDPNLIQVYTQALIQSGNAQEAERLALALIQKQKSYLPIYGVLYRQYMATHRPSDAEGILKTEVDNNPKQALCVLELAGHYHRTGKTDEMTSMLHRLLDHPKDFPQAHAQVGDFYAGIGMMEQAQRQYQAGMLSDPARKLEYQMRIARVLEVQGKRDEAVGVLDQVTKNRPKDEAALTVRANLLLESGKPEKVDAALQAFQALVDKKPEDAERRFNLGRAYLAKGNLEQAQGQFREAILRRPGYVAPRLALAEISLTTRNYNDQLRYVNEVEARGVETPRVRLLKAIALMGLGRYTEASAELNSLLQAAPQYRDARLHLGLLYIAQKRFKEAEELFQTLHREYPSELRTVEGLAEIKLQQKQFDKAVGIWTAELKKMPDSKYVRQELARTAMRAGQYDLAIAQYRLLVAAKPDSAEFQSKLGEACLAKRDFDCGMASFEKLTKLTPQNSTAFLELAVIQQSKGRAQEAEANYRRALALQSDNALASNNLAFLLAERGGDLKEAARLAERAQSKEPANANYSDTVGWIYLKQKMGDPARQIFDRLVRKYPQNPTFRYHLAMALLQKGDKVSARKELQVALANQPAKADEAKIRQALAGSQ